MGVTAVLQPVVQAALGSDLPARVDCWGGSVLGPGARVGHDTVVAVAKAVVRIGALARPPRSPAEQVLLSDRRHALGRDAKAVSHRPAKLDLVARTLGLASGMSRLDVGCGWGALVIHAACEYWATGVGVTLSEEQAVFARSAVVSLRIAERVDIRVQNDRDVTDGPYDAIVGIRMSEHAGLSQIGEYAAHLPTLLVPEGQLLNHAISRRPGPPGDPQGDRASFIDRHVFPDGQRHSLSTMVGVLESAGLEVPDVESLREHDAETLRTSVADLEQNWAQAVIRPGAGRASVWRLTPRYLRGGWPTLDHDRGGVPEHPPRWTATMTSTTVHARSRASLASRCGGASRGHRPAGPEARRERPRLPLITTDRRRRDRTRREGHRHERPARLPAVATGHPPSRKDHPWESTIFPTRTTVPRPG